MHDVVVRIEKEAALDIVQVAQHLMRNPILPRSTAAADTAEDALKFLESELVIAQTCDCLRVGQLLPSSYEDSHVESVESDSGGAECGIGSWGGKGISQLFGEGKLGDAVRHCDG